MSGERRTTVSTIPRIFDVRGRCLDDDVKLIVITYVQQRLRKPGTVRFDLLDEVLYLA